MANSVDPDQTAPSGAVWAGSTLFVYVILSDALVFKFLGHLPYFLRKSGLTFFVVYQQDDLGEMSTLSFLGKYK